MKNYVGQPLALTLLLLLFLTALSFLPAGLSIAGFQLRPMDIFSDVRRTPLAADSSMVAALDSTAYFLEDTAALALQDTLRQDSIGPLPPKDSAFFGKII